MAGAAFILYSSVIGKPHGFKAMPVRIGRGTPLPRCPLIRQAVHAVSTASVSVPLTPETPYRNIGFTYKNAKARQVLIRADFTGWKGIPMKRDAKGIWSYQAQLTPGEYAYCFTVDDKIIKDPASKHTKRIAQTLVSAITVEKAPVKVSP